MTHPRSLPAELGLALLVLGLVATVSRSVGTAGWTGGLEALPWLALAAAAVGIASGRARRVPGPLALVAAGLLVAGELAVWAAASGQVAGLQAAAEGGSGTGVDWLRPVLVAACCAGAGWLGFAVLRGRPAMAGVLPLGVLLAATLLNYPDGEGWAAPLFLALTIALLLATGRDRVSAVAAAAAGLPSGGRLLGPWAAGAGLGLVAILVGCWLPPASSSDRSAGVPVLEALASLERQLGGAPPSGSFGTVGFSTDLPLGGPLREPSSDPIVLRYRAVSASDSAAPTYLRGANLTQDGQQGWRLLGSGATVNLPRGTTAPGAAADASTSTSSYQVDVLDPPPGAADTIFYPAGQLVTLGRDAELVQANLGGFLRLSGPGPAGQGSMVSVEPRSGGFVVTGPGASRLLGPAPQGADQVLSATRTSAGVYDVQVARSTATADQLRAAGTSYPSWLAPYLRLPVTGGARSSDWRRIHDLAVRVTSHATNPYDAAAAIESFLRSHYRYTLTPPTPPAGTDPVVFFLFTSRQGYCQFFAASMGDMLRALGLPVRLVNGFGPGTWDARHQDYVVHESDAHTWVEVYFPTYGWISFEPTPSSPYEPIPRGAVTPACSGTGCSTSTPGAASTAASGGGQARPEAPAASSQAASRSQVRSTPDRREVDLLVAAALGAAVAGAAGALLFLNPRRAGAAWRRTLLLSRLAGVPPRRGETPSEFGRRLATALPEAGQAVGSLVEAVSAVAYAPPPVASRHAPAVGRSWRLTRPALLRRIWRRLAGRLLPWTAAGR